MLSCERVRLQPSAYACVRAHYKYKSTKQFPWQTCRSERFRSSACAYMYTYCARKSVEFSSGITRARACVRVRVSLLRGFACVSGLLRVREERVHRANASRTQTRFLFRMYYMSAPHVHMSAPQVFMPYHWNPQLCVCLFSFRHS